MISEAVQLKLAEELPQILTAIGVIVGAYFSYRSMIHAKDASVTGRQTEQNTNHNQEVLVAEVRKASFLAGQKKEKDDATERDASYQAGKQSEREGNPTG